jgi:hypothetical protein
VSTIVAIHQPNFFPWLGYFDKIRRADVFVFLDAVAYPRSGSSSMGCWCNRVRLAIQGEPRWVTCPIRRMPLGMPIRDAEIDDAQPWRAKLLRTLRANYGRAPHFDAGIAFLEPLIGDSEQNLAKFNAKVIEAVAVRLGLSTRFVWQSGLTYSGAATELLVSLVKAVGGSTYLCGDGAGGYQQDDLFGSNGLGLVKQNFTHPVYGDPARFIPGLSVIDYLMWDGRPLETARASS